MRRMPAMKDIQDSHYQPAKINIQKKSSQKFILRTLLSFGWDGMLARQQV